MKSNFRGLQDEKWSWREYCFLGVTRWDFRQNNDTYRNLPHFRKVNFSREYHRVGLPPISFHRPSGAVPAGGGFACRPADLMAPTTADEKDAGVRPHAKSHSYRIYKLSDEIAVPIRSVIFAVFSRQKYSGTPKRSHERLEMITILSPAKKLNFEDPVPFRKRTEPIFADRAEYLVGKLKKISAKHLREMMGISENLAQLNAERYAKWSKSAIGELSKPAIYAFAGDVYVGLNAEEFTEAELVYAQVHLRILSGLYGMLRPLDAIMPYRLEMGTSWHITEKKKNLYDFWKSRLTEKLSEDIKSTSSNFVLDLASKEYSRVIDWKEIDLPVISPVFKEEREGEFKMISFFAKKARGMMAAFVIENRIENAEDLKAFDSEGYAWNQRLSDTENNQWVYTRQSNKNQTVKSHEV